MTASRQDYHSDVIVLRKTPYSDTSLIVAGLTPERGQIHFLIRGGRRISRKQFPVVDLFRLLSVDYREGRGELCNLGGAELVEDYSGVAHSVRCYRAASWLGAFSLRNILSGMEHPSYFSALRIGLGRLSSMALSGNVSESAVRAVVVGLCVVYLEEGGWLDVSDGAGSVGERCRALLAMALGAGPAPRLTAESWDGLLRWVFGCVREADCDVPDIPLI